MAAKKNLKLLKKMCKFKNKASIVIDWKSLMKNMVISRSHVT